MQGIRAACEYILAHTPDDVKLIPGHGNVAAKADLRKYLDVLNGTPVDGLLETGWRVARPLWGQGIAREAAEAVFAWAWAHGDDAAITAWTNPGNTRSWGLMERLGMRRRPDLAFHHPRYAVDDPNGAMLVYAIDRP